MKKSTRNSPFITLILFALAMLPTIASASTSCGLHSFKGIYTYSLVGTNSLGQDVIRDGRIVVNGAGGASLYGFKTANFLASTETNNTGSYSVTTGTVNLVTACIATLSWTMTNSTNKQNWRIALIGYYADATSTSTMNDRAATSGEVLMYQTGIEQAKGNIVRVW